MPCIEMHKASGKKLICRKSVLKTESVINRHCKLHIVYLGTVKEEELAYLLW